MPALQRPSELQLETIYRILSGPGKGEIGSCVERKESDFGHAWGLVKTKSGSYWTRYHMLEEVT